MQLLGKMDYYLALLILSLSSNVFADSPITPITTLDKVISRGDLNCGVYPDDPARSAINLEGQWQGFYVDFCRATAAAVLSNEDYVNYIEVGSTTRFTSLKESKTDVVMYSSTWTHGREDKYQLDFPAIYLFDGQGFIVRSATDIQSLDDLNNKTVCVTQDTSTHQNLMDLIENRKLNTKVLFSNGDSFFRGGPCDAYTADRLNLAANKANRTDKPENYRLLPDTISREPVGPMVRNDDAQWRRIIRAVVHALILAEEKNINASNVDQALAQSKNAEVQNLLGKKGKIGEQLGLDSKWAYRAIKAVGNYGEIYNRHFGLNSKIGIERGINQPWTQGGILYAPIFK